MYPATYLRNASNSIEKAIEGIANSPTAPTKATIDQINNLQEQVIALRNIAVTSARNSEWTLEEVGAAFEISPSRVSQIYRDTVPRRSRRIFTSALRRRGK